MHPLTNAYYSSHTATHRAAFQREVTLQKSLTYLPIQTAETKLLMRDVLRTPAKFMDHFRQYSANVVLKRTLYLLSL
jgi:hypothetical protein